jgi:DNA primase small subunit
MPSTNDSFPFVLCSSGSATLQHPQMTLPIENLPLHCRMMPIYGISLSRRQICKYYNLTIARNDGLTIQSLRKEILRLNPSRFEIGPVYTTNPRDRKTLRKSSNFRPLSKELVFDIDLTDYDEIRTCCSKADICNKCWQFITMAVKVVDTALRDDFGFKHIMWVYSGRRGAHAWICDKRAREMEDTKRKAIAGYLEVIKGGSQSGKKVNVKRPLHPHLA